MPRPYPPQFRQRAIALVREGRQIKQTAADLGIHEVTLHSWLRQDDIDHGHHPRGKELPSLGLPQKAEQLREFSLCEAQAPHGAFPAL